MAGDLTTYRGVVYPRHCDHVGHMNVMWNDETGDLVSRTTLKAVHLDTVARKSCTFPEAIAIRTTKPTRYMPAYFTINLLKGSNQ